jgi:dTDP-4-amino-4,6-dideoxygalactose transaminase
VDGVVLPAAPPNRRHVYHLFAVRVTERDRVLAQLAERGVQCGIHYPIPLHLTDAYALLGYRSGSFPVAEACAQEFLSLPMFPDLTAEQVDHVASVVREVVTPEACTCGAAR